MLFSLFSPVWEWCASDHHMPLLCRRFSSVAPYAALPAHLTVCKATAPDGAAVSACLSPHCGLFSADGLSGGTYTTTSRFSRLGERCTSHKTFCRRRQKLLRLPPDNCPVPWLSLPHRKGPLRGETPVKWTAGGAFAPLKGHMNVPSPVSGLSHIFQSGGSYECTWYQQGHRGWSSG